MRGLSTADFLHVWERGVGHSVALCSLEILVAACPELGAHALADLTVGQRDALLLEVRQLTFGPRLDATTRCPACAELLEFALQTDDLRLPGVEAAGQGDGTITWTDGQARVVYRLPRVSDLVAIADLSTPQAALSALLERCVLVAAVDGAEVPVHALAPEVVEELAAEMAGRDPQADLQLALTCPACGHGWQAPFDIAAFLWAEIAAAAKRLLREVHLLACTYGWREADILALSAWRRQAYLEMIQG